jgi:hypothetical protein
LGVRRNRQNAPTILLSPYSMIFSSPTTAFITESWKLECKARSVNKVQSPSLMGPHGIDAGGSHLPCLEECLSASLPEMPPSQRLVLTLQEVIGPAAHRDARLMTTGAAVRRRIRGPCAHLFCLVTATNLILLNRDVKETSDKWLGVIQICTLC